MRKSILIIGAVPHPDNLQTYGGTTTLMQNFLDFCGENGYPYQHIDTLKYKNRLLNLLYFGMRFLWGILTCKIVMYNVARNGAFTLFFHTVPLCYVLKRKVVFRMFGGNFLGLLEDCPPDKKMRMMALLAKTNILFFETKKILENIPMDLSQRANCIRWFPNCRKPSAIVRDRGYRKRFIFLSRVDESKGVDYLVNVAETLPPDYTVHLYGPLVGDKYKCPDFFQGKKAEYHGALKTDQVLSTLKEYDVLVLPTHWVAEGYPGIIIEAMSLGMPVIASRIGGIPEMVENGQNGILIEPHNPGALREAMLSFNTENYEFMSSQSLASFNRNYNSDVVNKRVYEAICAD